MRAPRSNGRLPTSSFGKKTAAFIIHKKSIGICPIKLTQEAKTFLYSETLCPSFLFIGEVFFLFGSTQKTTLIAFIGTENNDSDKTIDKKAVLYTSYGEILDVLD